MDELTPPTRSPWERPIPGQEPIEFDFAPVAAPAPPRKPNATRWAVLAGCVGLVVTGAVAFVAFANDSSDDPASGLLEVDAVTATSAAVSVPASSTAPSTVEPATSAPTPSTIGPTGVASGTYSFELASEAPTSTAQRFRMSTIADGQTSVVEGAIDESQRMQMTMSMGEGMIAMDVVLDVVDGVGYYSGPAFDDMLTGDAQWIGVNLEDAMADTGQSLEGLRENLWGRLPPRVTWWTSTPFRWV